MRNSTLVLNICLVAFFFSSSQSYAYFTYMPDANAKSQSSHSQAQGKGTAGIKQMPLDQALKSQIPPGWNAVVPEAKKALVVSWPEVMVDWQESVRYLAHQAGCITLIDSANRQVRLDYAEPSSSGAVSGIPSAASPLGSQNKPLSEAVLSVLSRPWKYTIPDISKRSIRVNWPERAEWHNAIHIMAEQAGCVAVFDKVNYRVTIKAQQQGPTTQSPQIHPVSYPQSEPTATSQSIAQPMSSHKMWRLAPGSLHDQLQTWAQSSGFQLVWKAMDDLEMESAALFQMSFVEAVTNLFEGLNRAGHPMRVTIYKGNKVIEVLDN